MKLTFKEIVNREIDREYEVWRSHHIDIMKSKDGDIRIKSAFKEPVIFADTVFTLEREEVSLNEALEALEDGKEIESVVSGYKYVKEDECISTHDLNNICIDVMIKDETLFMLNEIKGKWYIND